MGLTWSSGFASSPVPSQSLSAETRHLDANRRSCRNRRLVGLVADRSCEFEPRSRPTDSFGQAEAMISRIQERDTKEYQPVCHTFALTHGHATRRAYTLLHGISNCPEQWRPFAQLLYEASHNVYVPRMPNNGYVDRLDTRAADLKAESLADYGSETVDVLHGLGQDTTVTGLSVGENVAAWMAFNRSDVQRSVIIAPSLLEYGVPTWHRRAPPRLANLAPNQPIWWNKDLKETIPGPPYAAPLVFSHSMAEQFRLGQSVIDQAHSQRALIPITMVLNENDTAISNEMAILLATSIQSDGGQADLVIIPKSVGADHDVINPHQANARVEVIYPMLLDLVTREP